MVNIYEVKSRIWLALALILSCYSPFHNLHSTLLFSYMYFDWNLCVAVKTVRSVGHSTKIHMNSTYMQLL